jgi:hypothetical protein
LKRLGVSDLPECLKGDFLPEGEVGGGFLGALAGSLALLRAINAVEADSSSVVVVQDFEGVVVEDGDDGAGEVSMSGETSRNYQRKPKEAGTGQ